jgi:hypothetical protein
VRITGEVVVTERDYRAITTTLARRVITRTRVLGLLLAFCGLVLIVVDDVTTGVAVLILAGAAEILLPWYLVSVIVKRGRPALVSPWRYEITDDGVRVQTGVRTSEIAWPNLTSHTSHPDFWIVQTPIEGQPAVIMKAAFSAENQQAIADELRRRHIEPRAGTQAR